MVSLVNRDGNRVFDSRVFDQPFRFKVASMIATIVSLIRRLDWQALQWRWPLPTWSVFVAAVLLAVLAIVTYWTRKPMPWSRRVVLIGLRCVTLWTLLLMIGGLALARFESQKADLIILLDDSASMQAPATASAPVSRFATAVNILGKDSQRLAKLEEQFELQIHTLKSPLDRQTLSESVREGTLTADFAASPLGTWWMESLLAQRGRRTAAVILLSDGIVTEGRTLASGANLAADQQVPFVAVGLGSDQPASDIRVEDVLADAWALVGDRIEFRTTVRVTGLPDQEPIDVRLIDDDTQAVLDTVQIRSTGETRLEPVVLEFVADRERVANLSIVAQTFSGEENTANNVRDISVELRDQPLKVLLVQDQPSYEFRFLKHLLERARGMGEEAPALIDLTVVLQSSDAKYAQQDASAKVLPPVGVEQLAAFDTIILSDVAVALLGDVFLKQVAEVVESKGVGLVVVVGPRHLPQEIAGTPLESLLPVDVARVQSPEFFGAPVGIRWTVLGQQAASLRLSDQGAPRLPRLTAVWRAPVVRPLGRVLLESDQSSPTPIVVTQLVGAGQVRLQLTDEMFRLESFDGTGVLFERYWLQCIRELAKGKRRAVETDWELDVEGDRFVEGAAIPIRVRVDGQPAEG